MELVDALFESTTSGFVGAVTPIQTFPVLSIRIFSVLFVPNIKGAFLASQT